MSEPLLACTVLLLRESAGELEVFMAQRSHRVDFAEGATVFPGGRVDAADRDPRLRSLCRGGETLDDEAFAVRVAGLRETFEESGVFFALARGEDTLVDPERGRGLGERYREPLARGELAIVDVLEREGLLLQPDALVPWARWITPSILPKRFDTYFFVAAAPADQLPVHDGDELIASQWLTPNQALEDSREGRRKLVFATQMNLERLAGTAGVRGALDHARLQPIVPVHPQVVELPGGRTGVRIPEDAGYPRTLVETEGLARA